MNHEAMNLTWNSRVRQWISLESHEMDESRKLECLNFFFLQICFRAHESHLHVVVRSTSQRIRFKSMAATDARHSPLSSGPREDKFNIMKVSDIFDLIQYLKTEIEQEMHNSVKKTVSIYITTCR